VIVMGVSGSGKSTVAGLLAAELGWDLLEGDDLHPAANVAKMAAGHALTDADRAPWLTAIADWIATEVRAARSAVVSCSALARAYRDTLRRSISERPDTCLTLVYLTGDREQLRRRLAARHDHFMPAALLDSQLRRLEPPAEDEYAITLRIDAPAHDVAREALAAIRDRDHRPVIAPHPASGIRRQASASTSASGQPPAASRDATRATSSGPGCS
jgi:gluconokinase